MKVIQAGDDEPLLTPSEAGDVLGVSPKSLSRYELAGKLTAIRTPGGHRRYPESEVQALRKSSQDRHR